MKKAFHWKKIAIGVIAGVIVLAIAFTQIPYTPIQFSLVGEAVNPEGTEEAGPRLFWQDVHIHHWVIGLAIMLLALASAYYSALPSKIGQLLRMFGPMAGYMFGFGAILFLDQLPYVVGLIPFGV